MDGQSDPDTTPRPALLVRNASIDDRTPYVPRRKSSVENRHSAGAQDNKTATALDQPRNPSYLWRKKQGPVRASRLPAQIRRLSRNGRSSANQSSNLYNATNPQSQQPLPCLDRLSISSSESRGRRRLFSKIMSSLTNSHCHYSAPAVTGFAKSLAAAQGQTPRLSGSTAKDTDTSLRSSRLASTGSTTTSSVPTDRPRIDSTDSGNSPNPLRAPPLNLRSRGDSSEQHSSNSGLPGDAPPPAMATATLRCASDVVSTDSGKEATMWIAVDVECVVHYAEDPTSSLRSKAFGPPHTDPGLLTNLKLDLVPTDGCTTLRLIGTHTRGFLLPGETWTVVAQVLADAPIQRKQPGKAFGLQNRPHSHALMDQLHSMLSPCVSSSSQEIVHVSLTFDQVLLPSNIHCCTDESIILNRISNWRPGSGPQPLRRVSQKRRRHSDQAQEHQRRDDIGSKLLGLVESIVHSPDSSGDLGPREAIEILEEFFQHSSASKRLQQRTGRLLGHLEAKVRRPISRASARSLVKTGRGSSGSGRRRNGMDLSRDQLQLQDITNQQQWPCSSPCLPRPGDGGRSGTAGAGARKKADARNVVTTPVPAPLFSPRKRPSVAKLASSRRDENWNPAADGSIIEAEHEHGQVWNSSRHSSSVGPSSDARLRLYEDEMDEASRIWRGMRRESGGAGKELMTGDASSADVFYDMRSAAEAEQDEFREGGGEDESASAREILGAPWL